MKKQKLIGFLVIAVLVLGALGVYAVYKGHRPPADMPMVQWYPQDTMAYVSLTNLNLVKQRTETLEVYKAWQDVTGKTPWQSLDEMVAKQPAEAQQCVAALRDKLALFEGPVALGVLGKDTETNTPIWLMTSDLGENSEAFNVFWNEEVKGKILSQAGVAPRTVTHSGVSYEVFGHENVNLAVGQYQGTLFVSTHEGALQAALDRVVSNGDSIKNQPNFKKMVADLEHNDGLFAWLNVDLISKNLPESTWAAGLDQVKRLSGFDSIEAVAASSHIENGLFTDRFLLAVNGEPEGLLGMALSRKASSVYSVNAFPDTADFLTVATFDDPDVLYAELMATLEQELAPEKMAAIRAAVAAGEAYLQIGLEKDVLASMGNEWFLAMSQGVEGETPRFIAGLELRDEQVFRNLLETQLPNLQLMGVELDITTENGVTRYAIQVPENEYTGAGLKPQIAVGRNYLFIASDGAYLEQSIDALNNGETRNPLYMAVENQLPSKVNGFMVNRTGMWSFVPKIMCQKDPSHTCSVDEKETFDRLSAAMERLSPTAMTYSVTKSGIEMTASGPFPSFVLMGMVGATVALPSQVPVAPEQLAASESNHFETTLLTLNGLGAAAETYYLDHKEYPASMEAMPQVVVAQAGTVDGWGRDVRYTQIDRGFELASPGLDGAFDTLDDVRLVDGQPTYDQAYYSVPVTSLDNQPEKATTSTLSAFLDGFLRRGRGSALLSPGLLLGR